MGILDFTDDPRSVLIHFNPNHDKKTGKFTSSKYTNADGTLNARGQRRLELEKARKNKNLPNPERWLQDDIQYRKEAVDALSGVVKSLSDIESKKEVKRKTFDLSNMTDNELQARVRRVQLEKQYNDLMNPPTISKGREVVRKVLSYGGQALGLASSALAVALAVRKLRE